jgi:hypothetical protein
MTRFMKSARDILVAGTGFLLGMVFCYFLVASNWTEPERGLVTFVYGSFSSNTTNVVDLEALKLNWN